MTREEAKEVFLNRGFIDGIYDGNKWREACIVISKWLEQEPCEDAISRKSIKQKLQEHHDFFVNAYGGFSNLSLNDESRVDEIANCIAMVVNEPPVTPQESRNGHWISAADHYICPICGLIVVNPNHFIGRRCPQCGFQDKKDKEKKDGNDV